jgi:Gas vesicle synthesis protein GvpL/GvpF
MTETTSEREWAAAQLPRLLEEARAEALAEAKTILRRRHLEALLDAARPHAAEPRPPESSPRVESSPAATAVPHGESSPAASGLWVYGIVDGGAPDPDPALAGVDGAPVQAIRAAGLAALAGAVPLDRFGADALEASLEDLQRLEALARAHQSVLDRALERGGVVPFRLCTIYDGPDHVREMLERERESLAATLERVRGAAEWGVKAYLVAAPAREPAGAASGAAWLERKRADRAAAERARDAGEQRAAAIHARLGEHAAAAVLSRPHDRRLSGHEGEMVLNGAYLVASAQADEFGAVVDALAREHEADGLRLELTGPWAPYHFVGEEP